MLVARNEQLRADLLRSISHDLRTPLTSISGNAGILLSNEEVLGEEQRRQIYADIYDDSLWLINLVENLLYVTRIEDGTMQLRKSTELLDDILAEAVRHARRRRGEHRIKLQSTDDLILVKSGCAPDRSGGGQHHRQCDEIYAAGDGYRDRNGKKGSAGFRPDFRQRQRYIG